MTTELTHGTSVPATASRAEWANRREGGTDMHSRRPLAGLFSAFARSQDAGARWARLLMDYWQRRSLRTLSDRQLLDAGIDPARAGRGRAVDVKLDPNIGSGY